MCLPSPVHSLLFPRSLPSAPPSPLDRLCPWSVGVNLSPRLSPNTELYKLKPISLPGLGRATRATLFSFICCRQTCLVFFAAAKQPAVAVAVAISCLHAWLHGKVKDSFCLCECTYMSPFHVYVRVGLRIICARVVSTYAYLFTYTRMLNVFLRVVVCRVTVQYAHLTRTYTRCPKIIKRSFNHKLCRKQRKISIVLLRNA